jgi:hypothetical protein
MLRQTALSSARRAAALLAAGEAGGWSATTPIGGAPLLCCAAGSLSLARRSKATRTETDTFGPLEVPADK